MKKDQVAYLVLLIILISALLLRISTPNGSWVCLDGAWQKQGSPRQEKPKTVCETTNNNLEKFILEGDSKKEEIQTESEKLNIIEIENNDLIYSPFVLKGKAPGYWFFEGVLPVELQDDNNNLIVSTFASAVGEWMTTNPVEFKALLEFKTTANSGYIVIKNNNPSGLPENSKTVIFPVKFLQK